MDLIIIVNDQEKYKFDNVKSINVDVESIGETEILPNHANAYFKLKDNSEILLKLNEKEFEKFKIHSSSFLEVSKEIGISCQTQKTVLKLICQDIKNYC